MCRNTMSKRKKKSSNVVINKHLTFRSKIFNANDQNYRNRVVEEADDSDKLQNTKIKKQNEDL